MTSERSEKDKTLCNMADILQKAPKEVLEMALLDAVSALATVGMAEVERNTPPPDGMDKEYMHAVITEETLIRLLRSSAAELLAALSEEAS